MSELAKASIFLQGFNLPLAVTSYQREPYVLVLSAALNFVLAYLTTTRPQGEPGPSDMATAKNTLVATSSVNRGVRISMGLVQLYAAHRYVIATREETPFVWQALGWVGAFALSFVSTIWLSTGYYGQ